MHVSEPLEHLQELCDRTLSKDPWVAGSDREQKKDEKDNIATLRRESPETYLVHSSCRDEFPNKKAFCFVCDRDTPWSEHCQVKLNSDDVSLDYDRYTTGPTYRGPVISNANAEELLRENVVV
jgi:hypothetical protein